MARRLNSRIPSVPQETQLKANRPNFTIAKRDPGNLSTAQIERTKTKEQIAEEKRIYLSYRIKPLKIEGLGIQKLQEKARELWDAIVKLETEKYDLEERQKRQDYDVSVTNNRPRLSRALTRIPHPSSLYLHIVDRDERTAEAAAQTQSSEERSRP